MADILLQLSDSRAFALLSAALEPRYQCRRIQTLREVETYLPLGGPRGCVLGLFDKSIPAPLTELRSLRRKHPSLALILAADFSGREMDLYHLGRVNVDGVIRLEEKPSARDVLTVVNAALATCLAEVVVQTVAPDLPPIAQEAIRWTIERAESRPKVPDLAAALSLSPHTLLRELRAVEIATPRDLLLWARLIQASHLLERPSETVENVAFRLGYGTGSNLRKALKRHVGCSPTSLLERGGLAWTLSVFRREGLRQAGDAKTRWTTARSSRWRQATPAKGRPPRDSS